MHFRAAKAGKTEKTCVVQNLQLKNPPNLAEKQLFQLSKVRKDSPFEQMMT